MSFKKRGFAAIAIAAAFAGAAVAPASAAQSSAPQLAVHLPDVLVTPDSEGRQANVVIASAESFVAHDVTVQVDSSGLAGVATVTPVFPRQGCSASGALFTCRGTEIISAQLFLLTPNLLVKPLPGVAPGASGTWKVTISAAGLPTIHREATVSVVEGIDLTAPVSKLRMESTPGGTFTHSLEISNSGERAVDGVVAFFYPDFGFTSKLQYSNCTFVDGMMRTCVFDEQLAAGTGYVTSEAVPFRFREDLVAPRNQVLSVQWITVAEFEKLKKQLADLGGVGFLGQPGTGERLALQAKAQAGARGQQTDVNIADNWFDLLVDIKGDNDADLAAIGGSGSSSAGQVITLELGVKNLGPASRDQGSSDDGVGAFTFALPPGSSLTEMPEECAAWLGMPADANRDPVRENLAARYVRCFNPKPVLLAGDQATFPFKLRIDQVIPSAKGTVEVLTICPSCREDKNPANDTADVVLNTPAPALPTTGVQTGLIAGVGVLLALAGVAAFVLGRRRRVDVVE
ncbi:MAG TPA: LPXTG cell wall anchor domain-containing protein [Candidatus Limnocylindrales bacterium]